MHGSRVSITRTVDINKPGAEISLWTGAFFPWFASVTLEIDGFNLDLRCRRELKAFVARVCTTVYRDLPSLNPGYSRLLRLIAANYVSRLRSEKIGKNYFFVTRSLGLVSALSR